VCATEAPTLRDAGAGREVACHFPGELAAAGGTVDDQLAQRRLNEAMTPGPIRRTGRRA
jgi:hypothetical protein